MKRQRTELEEAVDQIIEVANERNESGELVQPIMQDATLVTFFYARYALLEVLQKRPILFLNLLRTNKELAAFWAEFDEWVWKVMLDHVLETESDSSYLKEIYPFFMVQNRRIKHYFALTDRDPLPFWRHEPDPKAYLSIGELSPKGPYYLVHYDDLTKRYIALLQLLHDFRQWVGYGHDAAKDYLRQYLRVRIPLICYHDYFLVDREEPGFNYNRDALYNGVSRILLLASSYRLQDDEKTIVIGNNSRPIGKRGIEIFRELQSVSMKLDRFITSIEPTAFAQRVAPKTILLDKATVQPYRDMLFDKEQGFYNTPEKQKALLIEILKSLPELHEEMIEKYGNALQCVSCYKDTLYVDQLTNQAFCSDACRHK